MQITRKMGYFGFNSLYCTITSLLTVATYFCFNEINYLYSLIFSEYYFFFLSLTYFTTGNHQLNQLSDRERAFRICFHTKQRWSSQFRTKLSRVWLLQVPGIWPRDVRREQIFAQCLQLPNRSEESPQSRLPVPQAIRPMEGWMLPLFAPRPPFFFSPQQRRVQSLLSQRQSAGGCRCGGMGAPDQKGRQLGRSCRP